MRSLHLEKTGLRGLTMAESFDRNDSCSALAGVVMRHDFVIDGLIFGTARLAGDDITDAILDMYVRLERSDISYILLSGMILSLYNVVDLTRLHDAVKIPVIGISYNESSDMTYSIRRRFAPSVAESKIALYKKLGIRTRIKLKTSRYVYVRTKGCTDVEATRILDILTLDGSVCEPARIAKISARAFDAFPKQAY